MTNKVVETENMFILTTETGEELSAVMFGKASEHRDTLFLIHTITHAEFRRKGYARELVKFIFDKAKKGGFKIAPVCPFIMQMLAEDPETARQILPGKEVEMFNEMMDELKAEGRTAKDLVHYGPRIVDPELEAFVDAPKTLH